MRRLLRLGVWVNLVAFIDHGVKDLGFVDKWCVVGGFCCWFGCGVHGCGVPDLG